MHYEHSESFRIIPVQYLGLKNNPASGYPLFFDNIYWMEMLTRLTLSILPWEFLPSPSDRPLGTAGIMDFSIRGRNTCCWYRHAPRAITKDVGFLEKGHWITLYMFWICCNGSAANLGRRWSNQIYMLVFYIK